MKQERCDYFLIDFILNIINPKIFLKLIKIMFHVIFHFVSLSVDTFKNFYFLCVVTNKIYCYLGGNIGLLKLKLPYGGLF